MPASAKLFDLADVIAEAVGGAVTIEDTQQNLLAYSAAQQDVDQDRIDTILGRRAPDDVAAQDDQSALRLVRRTDRPVFVEPIDDDGRPRVAIGIHDQPHGQEWLGTIWIVADEPLDADREEVLVSAARMVADVVVAGRTTPEDSSEEAGLPVDALTSGLADTVTIAAQMGLGQGPFVLVAIDLAPPGEADEPVGIGVRTARRRKLLASFSVHMSARFSATAAGFAASTLLAVIPLPSKRGAAEDSVADVVEYCRRFAALDLDSPLRIAVSAPAEKTSDLVVRRREALRALAVLPAAPFPQVVRTTDVALDVWLAQLRDLMLKQGAGPFGAYAALLAADRQRGSTHLATVQAWLECHGDIATASSKLHVHPNTFRYRLARMSEVCGLDLTDARTRSELDLQLRMFGVPQDE